MLPHFTRAPGAPPFLIAGPCVIESEALCLAIAGQLRAMADHLGLAVIFKASFDKANRTSGAAYRGLGLHEGLRVLEKVRRETGLPVLTDVHLPDQVAAVAEVVDMLQTPAFLARQTDLISAAAASGRPVNIKKAQFMAPHDMAAVLAKARAAATSAGSVKRPSGMRARKRSRLAGVSGTPMNCPSMGVSPIIGLTTQTRMRSFASSSARPLLVVMTAPLLPLYQHSPGPGRTPVVDATLTNTPPPCPRMTGTAARLMCHRLLTLTR
jgi:hypothetical protein